MDKYKLRISTFDSLDTLSVLSNVKPLNRMSIECQKGDLNNKDSYCNSDIIVIDKLVTTEQIEQMKSNKASYAKFVLTVEPDVFYTLDTDYIDSFFDVWLYEQRMLNYRMSRFMKLMLSTFDLELARNQMDSLIDGLPDLVWFKNSIGAHNKVNNAFCKTVGKTKEQVKDRGHCYIWDLDVEEYEQGEFICMETEITVMEERKEFFFDEKVKIGDEMRQLKTYKAPIFNRNNDVVGTVGFARDVTEIWNSTKEFKTLINNLPFPILMVNTDFNFVSCNRQFEDHFGECKNKNEVFDMQCFSDKWFGNDISFPKNPTISFERISEDGYGKKYYMVDKSPIYDVFKQLSGYAYIFRDVSTNKKYENQLKALSQLDELSQMNNRKGIRKFFDTNFNDVIRNRDMLSIIMLDLDHFKKYNDCYGHLMGDDVIRKMGKILGAIDNGDDWFAARFGGEEFIVIARGKTPKEMVEKAELIQKQLYDYNIPHIESTTSERVSVSIGIAHFKRIDGKLTAAQLINVADESLYKAKEDGRNRYNLEERD